MILAYWKYLDSIQVITDEYRLYTLPIRDVFKWLIDTGHLILEFETDEGRRRVEITYDEWFKDQELCKMDLNIYLKYLKKQK